MVSIEKRRAEIAGKLKARSDSYVGKSKSMPSVLEMAKNMVKSGVQAVGHFLSEGDFTVEEEEFLDRLEICSGCDNLEAETTRCSECGCFLNIKAWGASEICPLYKWPGDVIKAQMEED